MVELLAQPEVEWDELFRGHRAAVDFPAYRPYRTLAERDPRAKVVLTVRDPEAWYRSVLSTTCSASPPPLRTALFALRLLFSPRLRRLLRALNLARRLTQRLRRALRAQKRGLERVPGAP